MDSVSAHWSLILTCFRYSQFWNLHSFDHVPLMNHLPVKLVMVVDSFGMSVVTSFTHLFRNLVELLFLLWREQIRPQHFGCAANNLIQMLVYYLRFYHHNTRFILELVD